MSDLLKYIYSLNFDLIKFQGVIYSGTEITDEETFAKLPNELQDFLRERNGVIAFGGGLHIKSCSDKPIWNSLRKYWIGEDALHRTYESLEQTDIPFGHDCVGDHFILRDHQVFRLSGETGDIEGLKVGFKEFLELSIKNPDEYLMLGPLRQFENEGKKLKPGELLSVYPLFCMEESQHGISIQNISAEERIGFLKDIYKQIKDLPDGHRIEIKFV